MLPFESKDAEPSRVKDSTPSPPASSADWSGPASATGEGFPINARTSMLSMTNTPVLMFDSNSSTMFEVVAGTQVVLAVKNAYPTSLSPSSWGLSVSKVVNGPPSTLTLTSNSSDTPNWLALPQNCNLIPVLPAGIAMERRMEAPEAPSCAWGVAYREEVVVSSRSVASPVATQLPRPESNRSMSTKESVGYSTRTVSVSDAVLPASSVTISTMVWVPQVQSVVVSTSVDPRSAPS